MRISHLFVSRLAVEVEMQKKLRKKNILVHGLPAIILYEPDFTLFVPCTSCQATNTASLYS